MFDVGLFIMAQCHADVRVFAAVADHHTDASAAAVEPADMFWFVGFVGTQFFLSYL
jgi:hypothetical protein